MSDSVRPQRRQPTRLPRPWDSPGKNTGVGCHFLLQCRKVKSESEVAQSCRLFATPWTGACQAPPSMGFSRHEYWSGCHCLLRGKARRGLREVPRLQSAPCPQYPAPYMLSRNACLTHERKPGSGSPCLFQSDSLPNSS